MKHTLMALAALGMITTTEAAKRPWPVEGPDDLRLTVVVIDDKVGAPMPGVTIAGYFPNQERTKRTDERQRCKAVSDKDGRCEMHGLTDAGRAEVCVMAAPKGCEQNGSIKPLQFYEKDSAGWITGGLVVTAHVETAVFRVPMVELHKMLPDYPSDRHCEGEFAFDCIKGACVPPLGNGVHTDILFTVSGALPYNGKLNAYNHRVTIKVEFPGEGNGIVQITDRENLDAIYGPKKAPQSGFDKALELELIRYTDDNGTSHSTYSFFDKDNKRKFYAFRIRSRYDDQGQLVAGYYGKTFDGFLPGPHYPDDPLGICGLEYSMMICLKPLEPNLQSDYHTWSGACFDPEVFKFVKRDRGIKDDEE